MSSREWTPEQLELIEQGPDGLPRLKRVAVLADAGSGKTSVLVERVRRLGDGKRVLCVSFTEKSRADLEEKLSDRLSAEVYTIHGFCSRVVTEFGPSIGLSPLFRIMDQDETDELFYSCFEKAYRRSPPRNVHHGMETFLALCEKALEAGAGCVVRDLDPDAAGNGVQEFVDQVLRDFGEAKRAVRALEYSDLEHFAAELLSRREVAAALRNRYAHVFVDEFQDTSPIQCAIVHALIGEEGLVFVVGDEKQSIYRFRGADVGTFREFVATLPERRRLSANFRSHAEVIDSVNEVFLPAMDGYHPMVSRRIEKPAASEPAGPSGKWKGLDRVARVLCESDADGIEAVLRSLRAKGVSWSDVVLLLRRIRGNEGLFAELSKRGINVAVTSSASASTDESLGKLLNLWIWACEPWQKLRAARVIVDFGGALGLGGPVVQQSLPELLQLEASALSGLTEPQLSTCEAMLDALDQRFGLTGRFGSTFEQFKLLILTQQAKGLTPSRLARKLHRMLASGQDIGGFALLSPPANLSGSIRAITVHSAKGLEFPVVLLADLGGRRPPRGAVVRHGKQVWLLGRDDEGKLDKSNDEVKAALDDEARAEEQESARLLYVAMTRAKEALFILDRPPPPVSDESEKRAKKPRSTAPKAPTWAEWLAGGVARTIRLDALSTGIEGMGEEAAAAAAQAHPAPDSQASTWLADSRPSYSRARAGVSELARELAGAAGAVTSETASQWPIRTSKRFPRLTPDEAREFGTEIHAYFETEDWDGLLKCAHGRRLDLSEFLEWKDSGQGKLVFPPANGNSARVFREFGFEWALPGKPIVTGRVDRLVVFDDEAWVIDYKILLYPRAVEDLVATYQPQLKLYAEAVKTLTKFRAVRAFILDVACSTGTVCHEVGD